VWFVVVEIVKFHIAVSDNCLCSNSSVSASGDYLYVAWYGATALQPALCIPWRPAACLSRPQSTWPSYKLPLHHSQLVFSAARNK